MTIAEVRELSTNEIKTQLDEAYKKLWSLRFQHTTRQLQDTSQMKKTRHDIARMKTVLHERELWAAYEASQAQ